MIFPLISPLILLIKLIVYSNAFNLPNNKFPNKFPSRQSQSQPWFIVNVDSPNPPIKVAYLEDFGVSDLIQDNTDQFQLAIDSCSLNSIGCLLTFRSTGKVYKFNGGKRFQSIIFRNTSDFSFNGNDNTLVFSRPSFARLGQIGLADSSCIPITDFQPWKRGPIQRRALFFVENVNKAYFGNFKVSWDWEIWPLASLVTILPGSNDKSWILEFTDLKQLNQSINLNQFRGYRSLTSIDPIIKKFGHRFGNEIFAPTLSKPFVQQLGPTTLRIDWSSPSSGQPKIGGTYLLRHITYDLHMWQTLNISNVAWNDISIDSCPGKLFTINEDAKRLSFTNLVLDLNATNAPSSITTKETRHLTCASDGIFLLGAKDVYVKNVDFAYSGDDCLNILDPNTRQGPSLQGSGPGKTLGRIVIWNDNTLGIGGNWYNSFKKDDVIEFINGVTFEPITIMIVSNVSSDGCGAYNISFTSTFPPNLESFIIPSSTNDVGSFVLNNVVLINERLKGGNIIVDDLVCHNTRARGILFQSSNSILQNSLLYNISQSCIIIRANLWEKEGNGVKNVMIVENELKQCDLLGWFSGSGIDVFSWNSINSPLFTYNDSMYVNENIDIKNNVIGNVDNAAIHLSSTKNVVVDGNLFKQDLGWNFTIGNVDGKISIQSSNQVSIINNVWDSNIQQQVVFINDSNVFNLKQSGNVIQENTKPITTPWQSNPLQPKLPSYIPTIQPNTQVVKKQGEIKYPDVVCKSDPVTGVPEMDVWDDCIAAIYSPGWQPTSHSGKIMVGLLVWFVLLL